MIYIAHRGLFRGPSKIKENHPDQIMLALEQGYQCEVDIWVKNNKLYLGHDLPKYEIDESFIQRNKFWIHTKNTEALTWFRSCPTVYNYFWHDRDRYTLTSHHYFWCLAGQPMNGMCVMVMPEHLNRTLSTTQDNFHDDCYAICSDYVEFIKKEIKCD